MKVLITGAGGWLGSELTEKILEQGEDVRALVLSPSKKLDRLKEKFNNQLEIVVGNICNQDFVNKSLDGIDIVYHLAAKVHSLPKNKEEENQFFEINTHATEQLFNICLEKNIHRVIFYSSVSVYGESEEVIDINTPKNAVTPYAKSKLMAEEIGLKLFREQGLPLTIIQPVTVYGGDDVGNFEKLKSLINKGVVVRFGNGLNKKTIIYYKDLINMTIKIADDASNLGKVIICGTESISLNTILEILIESTSKKVVVLNINNYLTKAMINMFDLIGLGITKKIGRQIKVLSSNNEYSLDNCKKYINEFTRFREYYK